MKRILQIVCVSLSILTCSVAFADLVDLDGMCKQMNQPPRVDKVKWILDTYKDKFGPGTGTCYIRFVPKDGIEREIDLFIAPSAGWDYGYKVGYFKGRDRDRNDAGFLTFEGAKEYAIKAVNDACGVSSCN